MKLFGLHWAAHIGYLALLLGGFLFGKNKLEKVVFLKTEIGQVEQLALPEIKTFSALMVEEIDKNTGIIKNGQKRFAAHQAVALAEVFYQKYEGLKQCLKAGGKPSQVDWQVDLLTNYYALGDTLQAIFPNDSINQDYLDCCLFTDYAIYPPQQLDGWLANSRTDHTIQLISNLQLKVELALSMGLKSLVQGLQPSFDALMPVISYDDCPRAGQPFEADIYVLPYSTSVTNLTATINGQPVPIEKGLVHYQTTSNRPFSVVFTLKNPLTDEVETYSKEIKME